MLGPSFRWDPEHSKQIRTQRLRLTHEGDNSPQSAHTESFIILSIDFSLLNLRIDYLDLGVSNDYPDNIASIEFLIQDVQLLCIFSLRQINV